MFHRISKWDSHFNVNTSSYQVLDLTFVQIADMMRIPLRTSETVMEFEQWRRDHAKYQELKRRIQVKQEQARKEGKSTEQLDRWYSEADQKAQKLDAAISRAKNTGMFFGGFFKPSMTKSNKAVSGRSIIGLDMDNGMVQSDFEELKKILNNARCSYLLHTTHSHTRSKAKFRIYIPLNQLITDQGTFETIAKAFFYTFFPENWIERIDRTTYQWSRAMYLPSCPSDGEYLFHAVTNLPEFDIRRLNPGIVQYYETRRQTQPNPESLLDVIEPSIDPRKKRIRSIAWFCQRFTVTQAIETFLPEIYERTNFRPHGKLIARYRYVAGTGPNGLCVFANNLWAFSQHESDPAGWDPKSEKKHMVNAYDLVLIHKFRGDEYAMNEWIFYALKGPMPRYKEGSRLWKRQQLEGKRKIRQ